MNPPKILYINYYHDRRHHRSFWFESKSNDPDFLLLFNLKKPYSFRNSLTVCTLSRQRKPPPWSPASSTGLGGLSALRCPIFAGLLESPLICRAVMTDFRARLGELRLTIMISPISAGLRVAPLWKISSS